MRDERGEEPDREGDRQDEESPDSSESLQGVIGGPHGIHSDRHDDGENRRGYRSDRPGAESTGIRLLIRLAPLGESAEAE